MRFQPCLDKILIKRTEPVSVTTGGIYLPENAKEKLPEGIAISVGPGRNGVCMEVKVGDKVIYQKYAGCEVKIEDVSYLIVSEKEVIAVVDNS